MKEFLSRNIVALIILGLVIYVYLTGGLPQAASPGEKRDTTITYVVVQGKESSYTPDISLSIPPQSIPPQYTPDTSYKELLRQYEAIIQNYLSKNVVKDTIDLKDSTGAKIGEFRLEDTLSQNKIESRKPSYTLTIPQTTITITKQAPNRRQLYIGGELTTPLSQTLRLQQADLGLLYKNKKDNILGLSGNYNFPLQSPGITIKYYTKIKLH